MPVPAGSNARLLSRLGFLAQHRAFYQSVSFQVGRSISPRAWPPLAVALALVGIDVQVTAQYNCRVRVSLVHGCLHGTADILPLVNGHFHVPVLSAYRNFLSEVFVRLHPNS